MSNLPTAIDDQTSLYNPADSFSTKPLVTTTAALVLIGDTTIQLAASVASLGGPTAYGIVSIDDEEIIYTGSSGVNLTGCIRGSFGTTAIGHANGAVVKWRYVAGFDKALQAAVIAIETALGVNLSNVTAAPAGSDKDVQFNDSGNLGADHGKFCYDKATHHFGLGTDSPYSVMESFNEAAEAPYWTQTYCGTSYNTGFLGRRGRGTKASPSAPLTNDNLVTFGARVFDGSGWTGASVASVSMTATEDVSSGHMGTKMILGITPIGSGTRVDMEVIDGNGIHVAGLVESTVGGVKFPDGGTQATAMDDGAAVAALFSGSGDYLKSDGTKGTPSGSGYAGASGRFTGSMSIGGGSQYALAFDTADWDTDGYVNTSTGEFTVPHTAKYRVDVTIKYTVTLNYEARLYLYLNGGNVEYLQQSSDASQYSFNWSKTLSLSSGDVLLLKVGTGATTGTVDSGSTMQIQEL